MVEDLRLEGVPVIEVSSESKEFIRSCPDRRLVSNSVSLFRSQSMVKLSTVRWLIGKRTELSFIRDSSKVNEIEGKELDL